MSDSSGNSGADILGLLGVLFVGLKLTDYIDWSWWYVLLPFYGGAVLILALGLISAIVLFVMKLIID